MQVIGLVMEPRFCYHLWNLTKYDILVGGHRFVGWYGTSIWDPNLGPRFRTPIWDPDLRPWFGTPIWDPDFGPRFGTPIWDPDLGPDLGPRIRTPIWDPDLGLRFETLIWHGLGPWFGTPNWFWTPILDLVQTYDGNISWRLFICDSKKLAKDPAGNVWVNHEKSRERSRRRIPLFINSDFIGRHWWKTSTSRLWTNFPTSPSHQQAQKKAFVDLRVRSFSAFLFIYEPLHK
jgi:hypothetical protein